MGLLPVTRRQIVLSKRLAAFTVLAGCAVIHGIFALLIGVCAIWGRVPLVVFGASISRWITCTLSLYGIAWLFSTIIASGTISACAAAGVTVASWTASFVNTVTSQV